jgi:hypothetical protein
MFLRPIQFILILFLILFILLFSSKDIKELYDAKISNSNEIQCGSMCTKIFDCVGFTYNNNTNKCYLSKSILFDKPIKSVFKDDYVESLSQCNKISLVTDPLYANDIDFKRNATYSCRTNNIDQLKIYNNNKYKILNNIEELNNIELDEYQMGTIYWGINIDQEENPMLTQNKNKMDFEIMKEYDNEFLGQYLYPHKCVYNTSQKNCLQSCLDNKNCIGTEFNPLYMKNNNNLEIYSGICCPKIKIKKEILRREDVKFGKFYLKEKYIDRKNMQNNIYLAFNK